MMRTIDIGHKHTSLDRAMLAMETEISKTISCEKHSSIKIVHGHGTGVLRIAVREWCITNADRFRAIIFGEEHNLFNPASIKMRQESLLPKDRDFGKNNKAVTYLWLRRGDQSKFVE